VCAMNPCKCGYYPDRNKCTCTEAELQSYRNRLSGPLLDRIDLYAETSRVDIFQVSGQKKEESTQMIRKRIEKARKMQEIRFQNCTYDFNGEMDVEDIEKYCILGREEKSMLEHAYRKLNMSVRMYHKILKVSRTIADLEGEEKINCEHIGEALSFRMADKR